MSDSVNIQQSLKHLDASPRLSTYSKVIIHIDEETAIEVGNDSGRTLEFTNPFGTQAMANDILSRLTGFEFQPYRADGAHLDPAAEMGDAVTVRDIYGGIYSRDREYGRQMTADISAPYDEEINHEYQYESPSERKFKRETAEIKASISLTNESITAEVQRATQAEGVLASSISMNAEEISARVSATGGENASGSFAWSLTADGHRWYAGGNSTPVMEVTASGLTVNGIINAKQGGTIGGFSIGASSLYKGISSFGGSGSSGVYIGTNGIQLGQAFKVSSSGQVTATNITAQNMALTGTLTIAGTQITAANLRLGAERANSGYSGWNGTSATVNNNSSTWTTGANYGYQYNKAITGAVAASKFYVGYLYAQSYFSYQNYRVIWRYVNGIWYLCRAT